MDVKNILYFVFAGVILLSRPDQVAAAELVMFEQDMCEWCEVWHEEVGEVYAKTDESRTAPLRRIDIFETRPTDLKEVRRIQFTPTFVLMDEGREVGRILGYPGESFFWELLGQMLKKLPGESRRACLAPSVSPAQNQGEKTC